MERPPGVHKCRTPLGCPAQSCWGLAAQVLHDVGHERAEGDATVLIAFFCSALICAVVTSKPSGTKIGS